MREIKFRGKRIDTDEWVFGWYVGYSENNGYIYGDYVDKNEVWAVDAQTVGQYTGLKDKNGVEIYKGDILHHKWNSGNDMYLETISEVKFSRGAFVVDDKKRADWLLSLHALPKWAELEVIGNTYPDRTPRREA